MTGVWSAGLLVEVAIVTVAAVGAPLPVAVVVAQVVPLPVLLGLITWTQLWGGRLDRARGLAPTSVGDDTSPPDSQERA